MKTSAAMEPSATKSTSVDAYGMYTAHSAVAPVVRRHGMVMKAVPDCDWTVSVKVMESAADRHWSSPYHQRRVEAPAGSHP